MSTPTPGQKTIPLDDWKRFLRVADWFERTVEHGKGVLRTTYGQGQDVIVRTPEGGIDGRVGVICSSVTCIKCVLAKGVGAEIAGEKKIHETGEEIVVYNIYPDAVTGNVYVMTSLTTSGTRYVSGEPC